MATYATVDDLKMAADASVLLGLIGTLDINQRVNIEDASVYEILQNALQYGADMINTLLRKHDTLPLSEVDPAVKHFNVDFALWWLADRQARRQSNANNVPNPYQFRRDRAEKILKERLEYRIKNNNNLNHVNNMLGSTTDETENEDGFYSRHTLIERFF